MLIIFKLTKLSHSCAKRTIDIFQLSELTIKATAIDLRYFARGSFSRSLDHKKNFSLI